MDRKSPYEHKVSGHKRSTPTGKIIKVDPYKRGSGDPPKHKTFREYRKTVPLTLKVIERLHSERSKKSQLIDNKLRAPTTPSFKVWVHAPNEYDVLGVDSPGSELKSSSIRPEPYTHAQLSSNQMGGYYRVHLWDKKGEVHNDEFGFASKEEAMKFIEKVNNQNAPKYGASATYNVATGWIQIVFDEKPSRETLNQLKAEGFRYRPSTKAWKAKHNYSREELLKGLAGTIDDVDIPINYEGKAEYYEEKAQRTRKEADELRNRSRKLSDMIPFGQPILVGHHSEKRHRKDIDRIHKLQGKSIETREKAEQYERTAENFKAKAEGTENPITVKNRIKNLEKDIRRLEQYSIDETGEELESINRQIKSLKHRLEQQKKQYARTGGVLADVVEFKPGMVVHTTNGKARIKKVSGKSVRVELITDAKSLQGPPWNNMKIDKDKILKVYEDGS